MGVNITYMGTKRALTPAVNEVLRHAQSGTFLDAFSGMCSIGLSIGTARQVWSNDVQVFASEVAKALFVSRRAPLSPLSCGDSHFERYQSQKQLLTGSFASSLAEEQRLISATSFTDFADLTDKLRGALALEIARCRLRSPHLFTITYAGTFFGVQQAIETDAIVASINSAIKSRRVTRDEARWEVIALGRALLKIATSTGHFAQYLKPKLHNYRRHIALRKRSLWAEWLNSLSQLSPVGNLAWRRKNRVFNQDSLSLIPMLANHKANLGVIYADPPYTDDQYSRFYHILETLCLYDYPTVSGAGLYRPGRFHTPFSLKSEAAKALMILIQSCARAGADLILSYPTDGLATKAGADVRAMLRQHFKRVEVCHSLSHTHSTFGASKGSAQARRTELIYLARTA
jgi:adenine-specific DNA-methyltransferase